MSARKQQWWDRAGLTLEQAENTIKHWANDPICPNCGLQGMHYVAASLGDDGFYACEGINSTPVTYSQKYGWRRECLEDVIYDIKPTETPLLARIRANAAR